MSYALPYPFLFLPLLNYTPMEQHQQVPGPPHCRASPEQTQGHEEVACLSWALANLLLPVIPVVLGHQQAPGQPGHILKVQGRESSRHTEPLASRSTFFPLSKCALKAHCVPARSRSWSYSAEKSRHAPLPGSLHTIGDTL